MQVKVKNSCELRRYVSQNIQSNCLNSTVHVNKFGVLAKFVFSQDLFYLHVFKLNIDKSFSGTCDKVLFSPW